ncbi:MAG: M56 family metallopeptidase [Planctomycetota bacterium]
MNERFLSLAITHLWQVTIAFVIVYAISRLAFVKRRPHLMLLLWVLFSVKCLVPPVIETPVSLMRMLTPTALVDALPSTTPQPISAMSRRTSNPASTELAHQTDHQSTLTWADGIAWLWITGSLFVLVGFLGNYAAVRYQITAGSTAGDTNASAQGANTLLRELETQIGLPQRGVDFVVSDRSIGPLVFGFLRPTIVVPQEILARDIPLRPILTHELCHVWRRDHLLGFLQMAVQVIFWFHPLVWIASRRMNQLCEICCDDDTLRIFDLNSKSYASGLLDVLSLQQVVRPLHFAPGIRPLEVTKHRLKMIVANRRSKARRSQVILMGAFLCLMLPSSVPSFEVSGAITSENTSEPALATETPIQIPTDAELAKRRSQMDFLLGDWHVVDPSGNWIGSSTFRYEESGNMIREDWVAPDRSTAQGITFYDSNEQCWKMTWVDSNGVFMESAGQWQGNALVLNGYITHKTGIRKRAQIMLSRHDDQTITSQMKIDFQGTLRPVSSSRYLRKNAS